MSEAQAFPELAKLLAKHFRVSAALITPDTTAMDVRGWDSMTHTLLLIEVEKQFHVRLDEAEGFEVRNVGELAVLIEKTWEKEAK